KIERYRHNDVDHLERVMQSIPETSGKLLVTDGVFSMEGDLALVPELVAMCSRHGARIMIDDAHGMGVTGDGHGTAWQFNLTEKVDLIMSTFSKSFASLGGFIAGDEDTIDYIKHHARSLIFSASITPSQTAAALASLRIMREDPERIKRINNIGVKMRAGYKDLGFDVGKSVTPIIPILIGDDQKTFLFWRTLFENGVFVNPVISPAVAPGRQLLRTSYMATHTDAQLEKVLEIFKKVGKQVGVI
ncbi:MAG TPA: aminotransferase class I/II-fold pyridoxal phosphate-dependent enzyme, partial [Leptolinea sp.]